MRPPRPVPVNATAFKPTRLRARASSVVVSNESGYEWTERKGKGDHFSGPPLPFRGNGREERRRSNLAASKGWKEREKRI